MMVFIKIVILSIALFSTLLYVNNLISDLHDIRSFNGFMSQEEISKGNERALQFGKIRVFLSLIMSVSWALFIML